MDDGSTDKTEEVIQNFKDDRIIYHRQSNSGGPARPRNKGIELAKGDKIAFLDSDDWWLKNKLEISLNYLDQGTDLTFHDLWKVDLESNLQKTLLKTRQLHKPVFEDLIIHGNTIPNSSVVIKKRILEKIGGLNEERRMIAVEDYDAWLRISKFTDKFVSVFYVLMSKIYIQIG